MKKTLCLLIVMLMFSIAGYSQRKTVYLEPFKGSNGMSEQFLNDVRSRIYQRVMKMGRTTLVDGHRYGAQAAKAVNADYILRGYLTKANEHVDMGDREGEDWYEVEFEGTMQLLDAHTGNVVGEKTMSGRGHERIELPSLPRHDRNYRTEARRLEDEAADKAYESSVNSCGGLVNDLIDENVKIQVRIVGITDVRGNQVRGVIIDRGTFSGVSNGERFNVNLTTYVGNYLSTQKIAEIRVTGQPDQHQAKCKVVNGKDKLKQALDNNAQITIVSRTAKLFD